ncbi:MAG: IclR family transcriptional regulator [Pseudorhodoplanes sp.]
MRKASRTPRSPKVAPEAADAEAPAADQRNLVNSLAKGFRILESFTAERLEMTLSQVAAAAALDPGTTFRMLNTLVMLGYVARVPDTKLFRLTLKAADLGLNAIGHADLREIVRPILRSLVGELNEAASLGVLDGADILYIERVRAGLARLGVEIRIGTTIPASCSTIGHALLAHLPKQEVARVLAAVPRVGIMPTVPVSQAALDQTMSEVRRVGYLLRESYYNNGLRILAVPVLDIDGYPIAALSVAAPVVRTGADDFLSRTVAPVRAAAREIARAVQASGTISATA